MTHAEEHFDETIRHQIDVNRLGNTLADEMVADDEIGQVIAAGALVMLLGDRTANPVRYAETIALRTDRIREMRDEFIDQMNRLSAQEARREIVLLHRLLNGGVSTPTVGAISGVVRAPFAIQTTIRELFDGIIRRETVRLTRIGRAVRAGATDALTEIATVFRKTSTELAAIARTTTNHVSNAARETVFAANTDAIQALQWNSIFDSRTSAICRSRDGKVVILGTNPVPQGAELLQPQGARPPAHPNCRSVMTAIFVGEPIPKKENLEDWMRRQPAAFQDDAMGPTRAALFRRGGLDMDDFVEISGRPLNINELKQREPFAFDRASDPSQS